MLNRIIIMGRLTKDPELRRTQSGTPVCTFSVAVDRDRQSRESQERQTDFFDVTVWRQTAEFVCKYFNKGKMIIVEGSMQSRKWTDKAGQNRISWEVAATNVMFGETKSAGQGSEYGAPAYAGAPSAYGGAPAESYTAPASGSFSEIEEDGELPF
ncbi:MAG: single-stranded DNA-binding protein [Ruminococcaceae bacterium]|jgi:single-strand DNA-binding protein|nr:single-stranded DNA-binding protein [Oscillospiraceae bacterium]